MEDVKDVTKEIKEINDKLERLAEQNEFTLKASVVEIDKLQHMVNNIFLTN